MMRLPLMVPSGSGYFSRCVSETAFYPLVKWCRENEGFSWPWPHVESEKKRIKNLRREQEQEQQGGSEKK